MGGVSQGNAFLQVWGPQFDPKTPHEKQSVGIHDHNLKGGETMIETGTLEFDGLPNRLGQVQG